MRSGYRRSGLTDQNDLDLVPAGSYINFVAFSWEFLGKEKDLKDFSFFAIGIVLIVLVSIKKNKFEERK